MQTFKTPLVGSINTRGAFSSTLPGADQRFSRCIFNREVNRAMNSATWYAEKIIGWESATTVASGKNGHAIFCSPSTQYIVTGVAASGVFLSSIYASFQGAAPTLCGVLTGQANSISEVVLGGITYFMIHADNGTGWYLASDAFQNTAYTGDGNNSITITDLKVAGVPSVAGLYVGQKLTGTNIVAGSRIASINPGAFSLTLDTATTGGAFNDLAITKEPVAKIIDPDFPSTSVGGFVEADGYVAIMTSDGKVCNSDLNSVTSWPASGFIGASISTDKGVGLAKYKNIILAFGNNSMEGFYNAGNAAGSPFSRSEQLFSKVGAYYNASFNLMASCGDNLFWVGNVEGVGRGVYMLNGFTPKKVSTGTIDRILASGVVMQLTAFTYSGQTFLFVSSANSAATLKGLLYSVDLDYWVESGFPAGYFIAGTTGEQSGGNLYAVGTDKLFRISGSSYTDDGAAYTMSIQLQTDMGTNKRKFYTALRINADNQTSGNIAVSYSDDDGVTWSTPRNVSLTSNMKQLTRLGSGKGRRLWKFEDSGNNANRIQGIEIDFEEAAH